MKIQILSDVHNEFEVYAIPRTDAGVVVLAGDMGSGSRGVDLAAKQIPDRPVVFVVGNHEFYGRELAATMAEIRRAAQGTNVHVLENDSFLYGGIRFLGCSLWTDFCLFGAGRQRLASMRAAESLLNDYRKISIDPGARRLGAEDTLAFHMESRRWLEERLSERYAGPTVVVTHHAPSPMSLQARYATDPASAAFASDLESLIQTRQPALWIHGHTHHCVDYRIGATRILSNQRGYPHELASGFNGSLVVEVPETA